MAWKRGSDLIPCDQQRALQRWERNPPFTNDNEWLAHTRFRVNGKGRLDGRARNCYSSPTLAMLSFAIPEAAQ